jgi:hypothetical protein
VREVELGHSSRFGQRGQTMVHVAASAADAAAYLAEYFLTHRSLN